MREGKNSCVQVYCGEGKGKTTAAIGAAIRAAGRGMPVLFARFLKTEDSGEVTVLDSIDGIDVVHVEKSFGFYGNLSAEEQQEMKAYFQNYWATIRKCIENGAYQLLVLDEMLGAVGLEIIDEADLTAFLQNRPENLEVILTGRDLSWKLMEEADYISGVMKIRHPFDSGQAARAGIEY